MAPLLKGLLGNDSNRETVEEMRTLLQEMHQERGRHEALLKNIRVAVERLQQLGEPIAKAGSEVDAVSARLADLDQRFAAMAHMAARLQTLDERAIVLTQSQQRAETEIAATLEEARGVHSVFEELSQKVDLAVSLKDGLATFLEIEKPFQQLRGEAEGLRTQVEATGEHMARLRDQQDRLMDAHKLAVTKMEALDRRRDDLGRSLQDKERRVGAVEQAVRGMDGVQNTVDGIKREIGTLKALGDSVVQKTAALEAQREAVERALAQADHLDRAMRQLDAGIRQQQENEKTLGALQDHVVALKSLHEMVVERSTEISQLQREAEEQTRVTRQDLVAVTDEMKKTVERFDFESRGLESVSQRVADLRGALSDCENRFKGLNESSQLAAELKAHTHTLATHLNALTEEVGQVDQEMVKLSAIRRDLDEAGRAAREIGAQIGQIEQAQPAVEAALGDLEQLGGAHAMVKDALEQTQVAHEEITRVRGSQAQTRSWLASVEQSLGELRDQVGQLHRMAPTIEVVRNQAQRLGESMAAVESRREFVDDLHRRMSDLGALSASLDERIKQLQTRMDTAEQRFVGLGASAEEAERLSVTIGTVSSNVNESERKAEEIGKAVAAIGARCESVEDLAEKTRALRPELEQRHHALKEATQDLQHASALRKEAAISAQKLGELAKRLTSAITTADQRVERVDELSRQIEDRAASLRSVETRLQQFEERLAKWDPVEKEIARSLEQISARQGTVESLQTDLDRMFTTSEKTAAQVREITSAQQEVEQSRKLLHDVMGRLDEFRETTDALDERKRQMTKAEERLARAEALLVDVQSSLETLQGQKAIVDQAVEKAGSLQFLLKQAETTIEGLREEREMMTRVRTAVAGVRPDEGEGEEDVKAA